MAAFVIVLAAAVIGWFMFGAIAGKGCVEPDREGETGHYVADVEHGADGKPLSGWRLELARRWEQFACPLCRPINKLLGRE